MTRRLLNWRHEFISTAFIVITELVSLEIELTSRAVLTVTTEGFEARE